MGEGEISSLAASEGLENGKNRTFCPKKAVFGVNRRAGHKNFHPVLEVYGRMPIGKWGEIIDIDGFLDP